MIPDADCCAEFVPANLKDVDVLVKAHILNINALVVAIRWKACQYLLLSCPFCLCKTANQN